MTRADAIAFLPALVRHLVESTLFLLAMLGAATVLRRRITAGSRFSLALLGIVKFAIPGALFAPLFRRLLPRASVVVPDSLQTLGGAFAAVQRVAVPSLWPTVAIAAWLSIALLIVMRLAVGRRRLINMAIRTASTATAREAEALMRAARRLGVRRSIDLVRSAIAEAPAVLRIIRPVIVLPHGSCDDLSDGELESLLCHEIAHVARHDNLVARVESFICALFWFHPLIWIAQRITVIERERACDEVVAGSADERETYLTALTKFCHSAIAPRLPGVSCMATANLKERIDHVMNFPSIKARALSATRVTFAGAAMLVLFTAAAAVDAPARATESADQPYRVRIAASRNHANVLVQATVTDKATQTVLWAPKITLDASRKATMLGNSGLADFQLITSTAGDEGVVVKVMVSKGGNVVQSAEATITPAQSAAGARVYQGEPITLSLKDAKLTDVFNTFGKLTGIEMQVADDVQGSVTIDWVDVPWDAALDGIINDNGLKYRLEGRKMFISKK